jgi:hypothetical protein
MVTLRLFVASVMLVACKEDGAMHTGDATVDTVPIVCSTGDLSKVKFTQADGCFNDGSVEFCIPMGDATVMSAVSTVSESITCAPGGGRAMCTGSELLCFYPTVIRVECPIEHGVRTGAMTDAVWQDMCDLSAISQIDEIVRTIAP